MIFFGLEKASLLDTSCGNSGFHSNIGVLRTERKADKTCGRSLHNAVPAAVAVTPPDRCKQCVPFSLNTVRNSCSLCHGCRRGQPLEVWLPAVKSLA